MSDGRIIPREASLSGIINGAVSVAFFGFHRARGVAGLAADRIPQTFMVTLMGSRVPCLIVGNRRGAARGPIVLRAIGIGVAALLVLDGGGWLLLHGAAVPTIPALMLEIRYCALLGVIVTPVAFIL